MRVCMRGIQIVCIQLYVYVWCVCVAYVHASYMCMCVCMVHVYAWYMMCMHVWYMCMYVCVCVVLISICASMVYVHVWHMRMGDIYVCISICVYMWVYIRVNVSRSPTYEPNLAPPALPPAQILSRCLCMYIVFNLLVCMQVFGNCWRCLKCQSWYHQCNTVLLRAVSAHDIYDIYIMPVKNEPYRYSVGSAVACFKNNVRYWCHRVSIWAIARWTSFRTTSSHNGVGSGIHYFCSRIPERSGVCKADWCLGEDWIR